MTEVGGYREWGRRLSNWGRWGHDDVLGTLNLLTPSRRAAGARLIVTGESVPLGLEFNADGPQDASGTSRGNPIHVMTRTGASQPESGGFLYMDDLVFLHTQCATQVDSLAHVAYDGQLYNGHPATAVDRSGAAVLGVETLKGGIQGRAVLADVARHRGVDSLGAADLITAQELRECLRSQGVDVREGDILLIRTGWIRAFHDDGNGRRYLASEPGIGLDTVEWLAATGVSFLGSDNWGVEWAPGSPRDEEMPVHCVLIRDMGMALGEMFDLEQLSQRCAAQARWEFFFSCLPLPITGGVGAPVAPIATF